jgi:hypothetical protein
MTVCALCSAASSYAPFFRLLLATQVYKLDLPDMLFILNTNDAPICTEEHALRGKA